jgi:hypothetical protein
MIKKNDVASIYQDIVSVKKAKRGQEYLLDEILSSSIAFECDVSLSKVNKTHSIDHHHHHHHHLCMCLEAKVHRACECKVK